MTLGYNLIARVLPPFTEMAARGERRELRTTIRRLASDGEVVRIRGGQVGLGLGPRSCADEVGAEHPGGTDATNVGAPAVPWAAPIL